MHIRTRKLIGGVGLFGLVTVGALPARGLAQAVLTSTNSLYAWIYYVVFGIGWVLPAMPLGRWMSRPDPVR